MSKREKSFNNAESPREGFPRTMDQIGKIVESARALSEKDTQVQALMMRNILVDINNFFGKLFTQYDVSQGMTSEFEKFRREVGPFFEFIADQLDDALAAEKPQTPVENAEVLAQQIQPFMEQLDNIRYEYTAGNIDNTKAVIHIVQMVDRFYRQAKKEHWLQ